MLRRQRTRPAHRRYHASKAITTCCAATARQHARFHVPAATTRNTPPREQRARRDTRHFSQQPRNGKTPDGYQPYAQDETYRLALRGWQDRSLIAARRPRGNRGAATSTGVEPESAGRADEVEITWGAVRCRRAATLAAWPGFRRSSGVVTRGWCPCATCGIVLEFAKSRANVPRIIASFRRFDPTALPHAIVALPEAMMRGHGGKRGGTRIPPERMAGLRRA